MTNLSTTQLLPYYYEASNDFGQVAAILKPLIGDDYNAFPFAIAFYNLA